jgi:prolipoprotein diacylglyceryltransferase
MGKLQNTSQRRQATSGSGSYVQSVVLILAGIALYAWAGLADRAGGGLSFDNRLGAVYGVMYLAGVALAVVGFVQFCKKRG